MSENTWLDAGLIFPAEPNYFQGDLLAGETLFPELVLARVEPPEKLSADRRRTVRQRADVARGVHPLTGGPLTSDPEARCGNCRFRELFAYHRRSYPKCTYTTSNEHPPPHLTHSAASDVRAWWPGCMDHSWGDPGLSPDAARYRSESADA